MRIAANLPENVIIELDRAEQDPIDSSTGRFFPKLPKQLEQEPGVMLTSKHSSKRILGGEPINAINV